MSPASAPTPPGEPLPADALARLYTLELRSHLLEAAAILDRIEAAGGCADARLRAVTAAASVLLDGQPDRARRFQEHLSL